MSGIYKKVEEKKKFVITEIFKAPSGIFHEQQAINAWIEGTGIVINSENYEYFLFGNITKTSDGTDGISATVCSPSKLTAESQYKLTENFINKEDQNLMAFKGIAKEFIQHPVSPDIHGIRFEPIEFIHRPIHISTNYIDIYSIKNSSEYALGRTYFMQARFGKNPREHPDQATSSFWMDAISHIYPYLFGDKEYMRELAKNFKN